jgi:hypothetical protein
MPSGGKIADDHVDASPYDERAAHLGLEEHRLVRRAAGAVENCDVLLSEVVA